MKPLDIVTIANFFDEVGEEWLEMFDWCPNEKLPHDQRKTYRIKDLFISTYRKKICQYTVDELEDCRAHFHMIFADNRIYAIQAKNEISSLKIMADGEMYDKVDTMKRTVDVDNSNNNDDITASVNRGTVKNKQGALAGTVDAVQLGDILDETQRVVNIDKLPDFFDRNVRQYNQNAGVNDEITDVTVTDTITVRGTSRMHGEQTNTFSQGNRAINEIRAHSLELRRLRAGFVECFNVLFY